MKHPTPQPLRLSSDFQGYVFMPTEVSWVWGKKMTAGWWQAKTAKKMGKRLQVWRHISNEAKSFIALCLEKE